MGSLFGTDGIRGTADASLVELAGEVGRALACASREGALGSVSGTPRVVVGRDTRTSGPEIEAALVKGLVSAGAHALLGGVLPTPAVAYLTASVGAEAGVVISASHNPPGDNGIKFFGPGGWKLGPKAQDRIEQLVGSPSDHDGGPGRAEDLTGALEAYVQHLVDTVSADLSGSRAVVDCANGAASHVAPAVLAKLGVDVMALNDDGNGALINEGAGATHPHVVSEASRRENAIGLAFDGDADRVLVADEMGEVVDGDGIMALIATQMHRQGTLSADTLAVTVMSNQALRRWCGSEGIKLIETPVGDRHVLEAMRAHGLVLGGEQAGHIIRLDRATTGDGILVGLNVLDIVSSENAKLFELVPFRPMPQVLVNVRTSSTGSESDGVRAAVNAAERRLGADGRVLVRRSGTEPIVRVMVEAPDGRLASELAELVAAAVRGD